MMKTCLMLIIAMALSPDIARAVADCRVVEYEDHLEASCGDVAVTSTSRSISSDARKKPSKELAPMGKVEIQPTGKTVGGLSAKKTAPKQAPRQRRRSETAIETAKALRTEQLLGSRQ